jgi:hypothetical protein
VTNEQWHSLLANAFYSRQDQEKVENIFQQFDTDNNGVMVNN